MKKKRYESQDFPTCLKNKIQCMFKMLTAFQNTIINTCKFFGYSLN